MKPYLRSALYLLIGYAGLVLMLLLLENSLLYHPSHAWFPPPVAEIEDVDLTCADGTRIHAWFLPAKDTDQVLLYCHGNGGNLSQRGQSLVRMRERLNTAVLIIDYPGYGKSGGAPSEHGCYQAADAAYAFLTDTKKFAPNKIILYGGSLGGGVVTDLASRKEHRALILVKAFTSAPDVACDIYWWLPVPIRTVMKNRFDNLAKIKSCKRPVFIAHGTADKLVPFAHGERLYAAANEPKKFLTLPGDDHNDPLPEEFFTALKEFLRKIPSEPEA